jgi:acyl-coenzyme A thioesterase 13
MNKAVELLKQNIGKNSKEANPSPFGRWLDGKVIEVEEGYVSLEFLVRPEFANPSGMIHGGAYAGIFDDVIGITTFTLGHEEFYAAINLNVDFLRPSQIGETITIKSRVLRSGKSIAHVEAEIFGPDGKLRAKASSNLSKTNFGLKKP